MKKDNCKKYQNYQKFKTCFSSYTIALLVFKYKMIKNFTTYNFPCMRKMIYLSKLWCHTVYPYIVPHHEPCRSRDSVTQNNHCYCYWETDELQLRKNEF